ncbi:DNA-binding CsgD family transcriptional regulator [Crossiella equi]|uniref:DNA-binding CsgD family transcriptional regulator n=1 Tax=Crossiella equi TaxID=130796 RepID=A0ABS5A715_9PSEU|nr:LuxR C-terminal-related transcriptional regulator [Crossiella equi]MBP2472395.1 DNA-binding CsgD family transcriptional regulator [Crossiella equi]
MSRDTLRTIEAARALRRRLVDGGRWNEASRMVAEVVAEVLARQEPISGPVLAGLAYAAGAPRPDTPKAPANPAKPMPLERVVAMRAVMEANRGGDREEVVAAARAVLASEAWTEPGCLWYSVLALVYAGELAEARQHADRAARAPHFQTIPRTRDSVAVLRARVATWSGEPQLAADTLVKLLDRGVFAQFAGIAVAWAVAALTELGEHGRAEDLLRAHDFDGALTDAPDRAELLFARGAHYLATGRHQLGYDDFRACGRELDGWAVHNPAVLPWRSQAALCAHALQRPVVAASLARAELMAARRWGAPKPLGVAMHALALAAPEPGSLALLTEAAELLAACGAKAEHDRARADLRTMEGVRGLTAQEIKIARLARAGHSNKEIAARLGLVIRTVELHLSSVYRKLGVTGRDALRALSSL